ncbi:OmpA family protein [Gymnodinialimonas ulvae]|uniref:OmpA family protein n=1 Tax=Gymnodinialimonas ulvae TaxID=3126504 RepID=UPI0030A37B16
MTLHGARKAGGTALLCLASFCLPHGASALDLAFPGTAELVQNTGPTRGQHPIADGVFDGTVVPLIQTDGLVQTLVWQITGSDVSTATILNTVTDQLTAQSYEISFNCSADACGGFDFRHALPVGQAPEMHIDLGNFHYLSASIDKDTGTERVAVMISAGGATTFVHVARVAPADAVDANPVVLSSRTPQGLVDEVTDLTRDTGDLVERLTRNGGAPLDDLRFETGASQLSGTTYPSLVALAAFLDSDPTRRIVLVGHTDTSGSLAGNIALSQARAEAVRQFLTRELGVDPSQVQAEGIGFLAPRASNTTPDGREANRRVEAVLTNPG